MAGGDAAEVLQFRKKRSIGLRSGHADLSVKRKRQILGKIGLGGED
jgi:hypothetical protein